MNVAAFLSMFAAPAVAQDDNAQDDTASDATINSDDLTDVEYFDISSDLSDFESTLSDLSVDPPAESWASRTPQSVEAVIEDASCPNDWDDVDLVEGQNVSCYTVIVPEDYEDPDSNELRLHVLKFYGNEDAKNNTDQAMFVPAGGPGVSSRQQAFASTFAPATDLGLPAIMWDHRGMGLSEPMLHCPGDLDDSVDALIQVQIDDACISSYADQDIEFKHYGTTNSAIDMDSIRRAFGKLSH